MSRFRSCFIFILLIFLVQILSYKVWFVEEAMGQSNDSSVNQNAVVSEKKAPIQKVVSPDDAKRGKENKSIHPKAVVSPNVKLGQGDKQEEEEIEKNIMEGALELLDRSHEEWVKGDLESALDLLDQAYALILDTDETPDIVRQKDDLRLLISKRILAIYSSMQTVTNGKRSEVPLIMNSDVEKEIRSFQTVEREFFAQSYKRSFLYRPIIVRELAKAGLPEELSWLPLVESGFKVFALSKARALGPWQFIPSTGYKYNLDRDEWVDERMDIEKSTKAAIDYLKELHLMFGDWLTVLAAYNCGEGRVLKVISGQHTNYFDRFWDLYHQLPYETARYVPRFLATLHIIKNPKKYDMDLNNNKTNGDMPYVYETVKTSKSMKLQDIAKYLETSEDTLAILNAELRYKATPDKEYDLKVPVNMVQKFKQVADQIPQWEKPQPSKPSKSSSSSSAVVIRHKVKKGQTIASIARRYKTSPSAISSYNNMSAKRKLLAGQTINVPIRGYRNVKYASTKKPNGNLKRETQIIRYKIKKGDTLASIAKNFGMSVSDVKKTNQLKGNNLKYGATIKIINRN